MTGLRAASLADGTELEVAGQRIARARTFSDVPAGAPLWYDNANGLAEIAVSGGSAAAGFGLAPGSEVRLHPPA
jgi:S-adenosylmethionine hydrolase